MIFRRIRMTFYKIRTILQQIGMIPLLYDGISPITLILSLHLLSLLYSGRKLS